MAVLPVGIGPVTGYQIERSLRFNSADSAYLNRTFSTPTAGTKWTWSGWVKRSALYATKNYQTIFGTQGAGAQGAIGFGQNGSDEISFKYSGFFRRFSTGLFRDVSAWYHIVVVIDTTQATEANRALLYVNGQTFPWTTSTSITQNDTTQINQNVVHNLGSNSGAGANEYYSGYLAEINFVDGQALTPSSFGQTNASTGVWEPINYTGTYGTNGFELSFADNSGTTSTTLGKDSSGNGNNWTPNNFSVTAGAGNDSLVDSPTSYGTGSAGGDVRGNYCTWNRLQTSSSITLNNGNLDGTISGGFLIYSCAGTIEVTTSKWYYETVVTAGHSTAYPIVGVCDLSQVTSGINTSFYSSTGSGNTTGIIAHATGTTVYLSNNTSTTDGVSYNKTTDVLMIAFDADLGKVWFGKNGTWNNSSNPATNTGGHTFSTVSGKGYRPYVQCNADTSNSWTSNFGQRAFAYTAPSGFKALCTQNLPTPTIGATSTTQANDYFNVVLWTGNGSDPRNITGVGFAPDFIWGKSRSSAYNHRLYDIVRGAQKALLSNATDAETTADDTMTAFLSDGFTVKNSLNTNADTYVSWNWNAGGSNATNTAGSITSTVRANTTSGFSIVTYTGTGANATVGHGLGVAPQMIIHKCRGTAATNWPVYHVGIGNTAVTYLNSTIATSTTSAWLNNTSPTSTVWTIGTDGDINGSTRTYVAYCFAPVAGYSAFGSYTGNGSTDGVFVYLGFRPRFIMIKRTDTTADWVIYDSARDTYNVNTLTLYPNLSNAEGVVNPANDFLSNGFKARNSTSTFNASGGTYIYAAFAESPFKYSLAR